MERADELTSSSAAPAAQAAHEQGAATAPPPPQALPFGHFSLADTGFPFAWFYVDLIVAAIAPAGHPGLEWPPRLAAWKAALARHPAVVKVLEELRPAAEEWLHSRLGQ